MRLGGSCPEDGSQGHVHYVDSDGEFEVNQTNGTSEENGMILLDETMSFHQEGITVVSLEGSLRRSRFQCEIQMDSTWR